MPAFLCNSTICRQIDTGSVPNPTDQEGAVRGRKFVAHPEQTYCLQYRLDLQAPEFTHCPHSPGHFQCQPKSEDTWPGRKQRVAASGGHVDIGKEIHVCEYIGRSVYFCNCFE